MKLLLRVTIIDDTLHEIYGGSMIPMTSVEVLQDLLRFAKDLTPLLTEKKLDGVIAGLAEAREVVNKYKAIQSEFEANEQKLFKAIEIEEANAEKSKALDVASANVQASVAAVIQRENELTEREKAVKAEADKLAKAIASYEKKDAKLTEALAKAEADAKEIETAKLAITAKLAKLQEVA